MRYVYILFRVVLCVDVPSPGSAVNAPAMTDEARATAGEKDEPMTKTYTFI